MRACLQHQCSAGSVLCVSESTVSALCKFTVEAGPKNTCSFFIGLHGFVFLLCGLRWACLNISREFLDNPVVMHDALLACKYTLYIAGL